MSFINASNCICCHFDFDNNLDSKISIGESEVFFSETKDINSRYPELRNYVTKEEQLKADKFYFSEDKETYVLCHALLRIILAKKLNTNPWSISFFIESNNKPAIINNPIWFNITHTKGAFAFAIFKHSYIGIDMEYISYNIDIPSVIENYFSKRERSFVLESQTDMSDRFFLIWTRKEALLKALGTGIITDLAQIEVSEHKNIINNKLFNDFNGGTNLYAHSLSSAPLLNYYISVALPQRATLLMNQLYEEDIDNYLHNF